jgi:hypothetical protein
MGTWQTSISERVTRFQAFHRRANPRPLLGFFRGSEYPLFRYPFSARLPAGRLCCDPRSGWPQRRPGSARCSCPDFTDLPQQCQPYRVAQAETLGCKGVEDRCSGRHEARLPRPDDGASRADEAQAKSLGSQPPAQVVDDQKMVGRSTGDAQGRDLAAVERRIRYEVGVGAVGQHSHPGQGPHVDAREVLPTSPNLGCDDLRHHNVTVHGR